MDNSTSCNDFSNNETNLYRWYAWISIVASFLFTFALAWIEFRRPCHSPHFQRRMAFSPLNLLLLAISFSCSFNNIFNHLYIETAIQEMGFADVSAAVFFILADFAGIMLNITYFLYAWKRGAPIFDAIAPKLVRWIPWYALMFFAIQAVDLAIYILSFFYIEINLYGILAQYLSMVGIFLVEGFEIFVTGCYLKYLSKISSDSVLEQDKFLKIVSYFGVASNVLGFVWLVSLLVLFFYPWDCSIGNLQNAWNLFLQTLSFMIPVPYVFLQLIMKEALRREELAEGAHKRDRIVQAKATLNTNQNEPTFDDKRNSRPVSGGTGKIGSVQKKEVF